MFLNGQIYWVLFFSNPLAPSDYIVAIKNIIKSYALEMKKQDSTIRIIAPALSYLNAVDNSGKRL